MPYRQYATDIAELLAFRTSGTFKRDTLFIGQALEAV
jgi:hypothetical protein